MELQIALGSSLSSFVTTFSNGVSFSSIVEQPSFSLRQSLKLGSITSDSLKLNISSTPAYCNEFVSASNKYIRFVRDNKIVFLGVLETYNRKIETATHNVYSVTYKSISESWKDAVFCADARSAYQKSPKDPNAHDIGNVADKPSYLEDLKKWRDEVYADYQSSTWKGNEILYKTYVEICNTISDIENESGSGSYVWTWAITKSDGWKICDPTNTEKSLVHHLISLLPSVSAFSVQCNVTRDTVVTAFKVDGADKIRDVLISVCEQNCIVIYVSGTKIILKDLFNQSGTATTITAIESDATLTDKPYLDKTFPDVRYCSKIDEVNYTGTYGQYLFHTKITDSLEPKDYYPSKHGKMLDIPVSPEIPDNCELFTTSVSSYGTNVYKRGMYWGRIEWNSFPKVIAWKQHYDKAYARVQLPDTAQCTIKEWGIYARGKATFVGYTDIVKSLHTDGDEKTFKYIYSSDDARKFDSCRYWQKCADSKYYTFYADNDLALGSLIALNNISNDALVIVSKTDKLDEFGGYTYTATDVIDSTKVSFDESYEAMNLDLPNDETLEVNASRSVIVCDHDGVPTDNSNVTISCTVGGSSNQPTCKCGNDTIALTQKFNVSDGVYSATNTWYAEISPTLGGADSKIYTFSLGALSKVLIISKLSNGYSQEVEYALGESNTDRPVNGYLAFSENVVLRFDSEDLVYEIYQNGVVQQRGTYVWLKATNEDGSVTYSCMSGTKGDKGDSGEDAKVLLLSSENTSLRHNKYSSQACSLLLYVSCQGYESQPELSYMEGSEKKVLTITDGVSIYTYQLNQSTAKTFTLNCDDDSTTLSLGIVEDATEYHGVQDSVPVNPTIGDSYVDSSNYSIRVYTMNGWKSLSECGFSLADQSAICASAQRDVLSNISPNSVVSSDFGYFNTIIAGTITAKYIKSQKGVFDDIEVKGNSLFNGKFNCPTIESLPNGSDGATGGTTIEADIPEYGGYGSSSQYDAIMSLLDGVDGIVSCTSSVYTSMAYALKSGTAVTFYNSSMGRIGSIERTQGMGYIYICSNVTSAQHLKIMYGYGDVLKLKGVQNGSAGLQSNQVYYTTINGHKVLCLV